MNLRPHKLFEPKTAQIVQTSGPTHFMSARPQELYEPTTPNLRPQKTYEPKAPQLTTSRYLPKSSRGSGTLSKKNYEPNTPQTLWTQGPINSMNLRPHKLFEPKTAQIVQTSGPTHFMSARPQELYEPTTPNLRPQKTYEPKAPQLTTSRYLPKSSRGSGTLSKKNYEPNTPQTLWTQGRINSMNLRPHKLFERKTPQIVQT